ncbi:MAG: phosphoglycerate dehydrogenase [Fastidiosipilaceae bacterium]|jgi:D-3-phosphoglycerate dehydrogenase
MKVLVPEKIASEALDTLRQKGFSVDEVRGKSAAELKEIICDYDALIVRSATQVDKDLIEEAHKLKIVGRAGTGVDNIDIPACTAKGIIVVNTPDANTNAAAELAVGLAYAVFRNIGEANMKSRRGDFRRGLMAGNELEGRVAGLIGFGRIAQNVAKKLKGVGMKILAYDPFMTRQRVEAFDVCYCETLEELLPQVDLISIHTPKTRETTNMIAAPQFALCKTGVRLVNAARGGLVNEADLYDALVSGKVKAAAMDVLAEEPNFNLDPTEQKYQNPLLTLDNFIYTPHLGASTAEASARVGFGVVDLIARGLRGEMVPAVNMPPISGSAEEMRPYISLAEKLGSIYFQAEQEAVSRIDIIYGGDLALQETGLLTLSVLKGFLAPISENRVNFVNVRQNVQEMGVQVNESSQKHCGRFQNLIKVCYTQTSGKVLSVSGTILATDIQMLVEFFGYEVDFPLKNHILAVQNENVPGVIGRVGTLLGSRNINIANLNWAGKEGKPRAQAFIAVDTEVSDEDIAALANVEGVLRISRLEFDN